jgi:Fibronectin type III domain
VVKGLTNGVTYSFTVSAENGFVAGPASVHTVNITAGAPAASSVTHVARIAKGAVKVTFKAGASNGAPIKSFTATCKSSNGGKTKSKSGKGSPIVVNGLTAKKTYRCSVTATNSRGTSPVSRASSPVKP